MYRGSDPKRGLTPYTPYTPTEDITMAMTEQAMTEQEAYDSLAGFIQDYIYEKKWEHLNPLQIASIEALQEMDHNLLLMAGTAQGKTEAAFLPAISRISQEDTSGIGILYISPLKALINDQFIRIEDMLRGQEIAITKWHGDSSVYRKEKLMEDPRGILQMTPESLEAMFCCHAERIRPLFENLAFVVIDEIHFFINDQRGIQLLALLERIQRLADCRPVRIGLSATIQNPETAVAFLNTGSPYEGKVLFYKAGNHHVTCSVTATRIGKVEYPERYFKKILKHTKGKRSLLFTHSRMQCEKIISGVREMALAYHLPDIYYVHHGSISKGSREETEKIMKQESGPILTGTTLTLELGIDIGDLDQVIQATDPPSISSMVQRLGRSGRRTGRSAISFQLRHREDKGDLKKLDLSLVRSIAMIELYFRSQHMEESRMPRYPFRFLLHTILSLICEKGCLQPHQLAAYVLEMAVFKHISQEQLRDILVHLIDLDVLTQYEDAALGLSDRGEEIVDNLNFYAVFDAEVAMSVYHNGVEIGMVERAYRPGNVFYLAGRSWEVTECHMDSQRIEVVETHISEEEEASIPFAGYGSMETDFQVMEKIHQILSDESEYAYVDEEAKGVIETLREKAVRYGIKEGLHMDRNTGDLLWFPVAGTRTITTLYHILRAHDLRCEEIYCREILFGIRLKGESPGHLLGICRTLAGEEVLIDNAYAARSMKYHGKYFNLLPDHIRAKEILEDLLDLEGARRLMAGMNSV